MLTHKHEKTPHCEGESLRGPQRKPVPNRLPGNGRPGQVIKLWLYFTGKGGIYPDSLLVNSICYYLTDFKNQEYTRALYSNYR